MVEVEYILDYWTMWGRIQLAPAHNCRGLTPRDPNSNCTAPRAVARSRALPTQSKACEPCLAAVLTVERTAA
jgi:hypothetical protein